MYHPLQTATTIRLLDIDPGDSTDVVTCRLRHCDLATNPDFEALSYVWGKPVFAARILCNSQVVHITPSLYQALKRVRLATTLRTVWADALCINQQDAAERSRQVQLMQHIYRDARRVLVWLGPDVFAVAWDAFEICNVIVRRPAGRELEDTIMGSLRVGPEAPNWASLVRLVECAWWSRVWIVQELVLARMAIVMWGPEEIEWSYISRAVHDLREADLIMPSSVFPPSVFDPIARLSAFKGGAMARVSLMDTMRLARPLHCSDSRDRIYGLLGLDFGRMASPQETALLAAIVPNYTKPVDQVYWEFAVLAFKFGVIEDVLRVVSHGLALDVWHQGSVPSWMPRWDIHYTQDFPSLPVFEELPLFDHNTFYKNLKPHVTGATNASLLILGARYGRITAISELLCDDGPTLIFDVIVKFWTHHLRPIIPEHAFSELNAELCKALTFFVPFKHPVSIFVTYFENGHVRSPHNEDPHSADVMLESLQYTLAEAEKQQGRLKSPVHTNWVFRNAVTNALRFTRLFLTEDGRVGLCSAASRVGDWVALIHKAGCPMLLRQQENFCRLVGGSYIPSLTTRAEVQQSSLNLEVEIVELR